MIQCIVLVAGPLPPCPPRIIDSSQVKKPCLKVPVCMGDNDVIGHYYLQVFMCVHVPMSMLKNVNVANAMQLLVCSCTDNACICYTA